MSDGKKFLICLVLGITVAFGGMILMVGLAVLGISLVFLLYYAVAGCKNVNKDIKVD